MGAYHLIDMILCASVPADTDESWGSASESRQKSWSRGSHCIPNCLKRPSPQQIQGKDPQFPQKSAIT